MSQEQKDKRGKPQDQKPDQVLTPEEKKKLEEKKKKGEELKKDLDKLMEEIDEVLEENAEEFVKSYVQRGGE